MLTNVPLGVAHNTRQVVLNHPNSMECDVYRKRVLRTEAASGGGPGEMGGAPTLGGMGVLKNEDEAEFDYVLVGEAKVLFAGIQQQASINDRDNAPEAAMQEAQIASLAKPGTPEFFEADNQDLIALKVGLGVVLAFTVEDVMGNVLIPPYTRKYLLQPRDDLHALEPILPG